MKLIWQNILYSIVNVTVEICYDTYRGVLNENENERFCRNGRIRTRRLSLKMKQMELAEEVDISNNHISSIERGIERPGLDSFIRICDVLDVTWIIFCWDLKSNNVPKNITDNLKLCTDEEIRLVEAMTQYLVEQHKKVKSVKETKSSWLLWKSN